MMKRKSSDLKQGWPLKPVGQVWQFGVNGKVRHLLVRIGPKGGVNIEELHTVFADAYGHVEFCMLCLSQDITYDVDSDIHYICRTCGHKYHFVNA